MQAQNRLVDGVRVLDEKAFVPFKARACIDLEARRANGYSAVKSDDIDKHRSDVFRLAQLLWADAAITLPDSIATRRLAVSSRWLGGDAGSLSGRG